MKRTPRFWLIYWGPVTLVCGVIFTLSSISPSVQPPQWFPGQDKVFHALVFGVLGLSLVRALAMTLSRPPIMCALWAWAGVLVFGISDEFHQSFVPNRAVEGADVVADVVGAFLFIAGWVGIRSVKR